tara:strand:- start:207 stop:521 length:315 start_codon:yes stop_codon:yes gene_type:complete
MSINNYIIKYNSISDKITELQDTKKKLERAILNNLSKTNKSFIINNKKYSAKQVISKEAFSQKYIEDKLTLIIKNKEQVSTIMNFLKNNRKENINIKLNCSKIK